MYTPSPIFQNRGDVIISGCQDLSAEGTTLNSQDPAAAAGCHCQCKNRTPETSDFFGGEAVLMTRMELPRLGRPVLDPLGRGPVRTH
jgi:hypothetical protein